jgi:hypothetical protein
MVSGSSAVSPWLQRAGTILHVHRHCFPQAPALRQPLTLIPVFYRAISSSSRTSTASKPSHPGTEAVPFHVNPAAALERFQLWQRGVLPLFTGSRVVSIQAMYLPFWAFAGDVTSRTAAQAAQRLSGETPALLVYSGSCLPRPMAEVIKCPARAAEPFRSSLLELDMQVNMC